MMKHLVFAVVLLAAVITVASTGVEPAAVGPDVVKQIAENGEADVIVLYKPQVSILSNAGNAALPMRNMTIDSMDLEILKRSPVVKGIFYDYPVHALLQDSTVLMNSTIVNSFEYDRNLTGSGQAVCVIDTGIDYTHPDLGGCSESSFLAGNCSKVVGGYDFVNSDTNPMDDNGHGTHVAGIVAANGSIRGVAPGATVVSLKALDNSGTGSSTNVINAVNWCTQNRTSYNITIISMSLGFDTLNSSYCDGFFEPITAIVNEAHAAGISVVAATGNNGNNGKIDMPACLRNVTSVASSTKADAISSFSNRNNVTDLMATGSTINSTRANGTSPSCTNSGQYSVCSGTSMAAPHVSGAFAVMRQFTLLENNTNLTPDQLENVFRITGKNITEGSINYPRINLYSAVLHFSKTPSIEFVSPTPSNGSKVQNISIKINITSSKNLSSAIIELNAVNYSLAGTQQNWNITFQSLPNLNYSYKVFVYDHVNKSNVSEVLNFEAGDFFPNVTIISPANNAYLNASNVTFLFNSTDEADAATNCTIYVDNAPNQTNATAERGISNFTVSYLFPGLHVWNIACIDSLSNNGSTSAYNFTVDLQIPAINITSPLNLTYNRTPLLNFSVTDNNTIGSCYYILNGIQYNASCVNSTLDAAMEGLNNFTLFVNDTAGNVNYTVQNFAVDIAPRLSVASPSNITYNSLNITINFTAIDVSTLDKCYYYNTTGNITFLDSCMNSTFIALNNSLNNITIYANDTAGNMNWTMINFSTDTIIPSITIESTYLLNASINDTSSLLFNATISEQPLTSLLEFNGTNFTMNGSSMSRYINISITKAGNFTFRIYVNDSAGNSNSTNGYVIVNDTISPSVSVSSPEATTYASSDISLAFTASDNIGISSCYYVLNSGLPVAGCSNVTFTASSGSNSITVYVNDTANNTNSTSVNFTYQIPVTQAVTSSSSSGGGGGGSSAKASQPVSNNQYSKSIGTISDVETVFPNTASVSEIRIEVINEVSNVRLIINEAGEAEITARVPDASFKYIKIDEFNITDADIRKAVIKFNVTSVWIRSMGFGNEDIVLQRFSSGSWQKLKTVQVSEDPFLVIYEAESPGLSLFSITGIKKVNASAVNETSNGAGNQTCSGPVLAVLGGQCTSYDTDCDVPEGWTVVDECPTYESNNWLLPALAIIIIVVVAVSFLLMRKPDSRKWKFNPDR